MTIYLAIITTVLVVTQVIRLIQNHIQLRRQRRLLEDDLAWIRDNNITLRDFEEQRKAYKLIVEYLENRMMHCCKED